MFPCLESSKVTWNGVVQGGDLRIALPRPAPFGRQLAPSARSAVPPRSQPGGIAGGSGGRGEGGIYSDCPAICIGGVNKGVAR